MNMKMTISEKTGKVTREWFLVDCAEGVSLGRLAAQVAKVLCGKHKACYTPNTDTGDCVVVINAAQIRITGNKMGSEFYQKFTGYPSGLNLTSRKSMMQRRPNFVIKEAVRRMLPKNLLADEMIKKMHVYADDKHPHAGQQPKLLSVKKPALR